MSLVLPYHEDLAISGGGFIHPNGSIIHAFGKHEVIAKNYCEGEIDCVEDPKSGLSIDYQALLSFKKSQLTPEQYQNYLLWLQEKEHLHENLYSDFLVLCLGFDKVEFIKTHTITTSNTHPHVRFYNYYLMDWDIDVLTKQLYNPHTKKFELNRELSYTGDYLDARAAEELEDIKRMTKRKDRTIFMK